MRNAGLHLGNMKYASVGSMLLILGVAWLSGCAAGGSAQGGAWQANPHPSFSRVLIVGVSTSFDQRCAFEFSMASWLSGTPQPVASCNSMLPKEPLTQANIERVAAASQADGVLTSTIVANQVSEQAGYRVPYYQVVGEGYVTGPLGAYGVPVAFVQLESFKTIPTVTGNIHIVTKLFAAKGAALVYSVETQTTSNDLQSDSTTIEAITAEIAGRLRRDGVLH